MPSWLSRIDPRKKKSAGASQSEPQPYEVMCACGQRTIGIRMPKHQQVMCKHCGEDLFILPRNVYPAPPPVVPDPVTPDVEEELALREAAEVETKRKSDGLLGELAEASRGETQKAQREAEELKKLRELRALKEEIEGKKSRRAKKKEAAAKAKAGKAKSKEELARQQEEAQNNPLTARVPLKEQLRKQVTPFRVIVVSAAVLVLATTWWQVRSGRIESARVRFEAARKEAMELLEVGDIAGAEPFLVEATEAADLVGRQDGTAVLVRQLNREANTLNNLSVTSVFSAVSSATSAEREDMSSILMSELGDRWVVLDTWVRPITRIDGDLIEYAIDIPLLTNNVLVQARVETEAFSMFKIDRTGAPLVFAAKVESCNVAGKKERPRMIVRFEGNSVRLWGSKLTYQALGFAEEELPVHLGQQASALGIEQ